MSKKTTATHQKIFAWMVNTPFFNKIQKKDLKESFFSDKTLFSPFSNIGRQKFPACCRIFIGKVVKTAF